MTVLDQRDNPFVGLRPFFDEDALYFFGRKDQTLDLLDLLRESRFVPVLGSSGSGKSSLVRAGLIPMLQGGFMVADRDGWRMAKCRPGDAPLENLAEALQYAMGEGRVPASAARLAQLIREEHTEAVLAYLRTRLSASENVFVLVDQFEELFAFRSAAGGDAEDDVASRTDPTRTAERIRRRQDAASLVSLLLALSQQTDIPVYVSITMRTDFLGDCDLFTGLPEAINRSGFLVPRLTRTQLREVVVGPPRLMGARVAPRLVDRVLNDVGDRGDRLPVMQHALLRTWEMWRLEGAVGPLDLQHFDAAGGLERALDKQAEDTVKAFDPELIERVFKRLTTTDVSRRRVRSPARFSDLLAVSGAKPAVLKALLDLCSAEGVNFLYGAPDGRPGDPRYDIVHESLIRQWTRLRGWVDEERDTRDWWIEMARKAQVDAESPGDDLLSPRALQSALERLAHRPPMAEWAARYANPGGASFDATMAYITRSRDAAASRRLRRIRLIGGTVIGFVVLGIYGAYNGWLADDTLRTAEAASRTVAIERLAVDDPTYASVLAAEFSPEELAEPAKVELVHKVLAGATAQAEYTGAWGVALSDSGTALAVLEYDGAVRLYPTDQRAPTIAIESDAMRNDVRFAHDGRSIYVSTLSGMVQQFARDDGRKLKEWSVSRRTLNGVRVSLDGRRLVAFDDRGGLYTWQVQDGRIDSLPVQDVALVEFDPARPGTVIVATSDGHMLRGNPSSPTLPFDTVGALSDAAGEQPVGMEINPRDGSFVVLGYRYSTRIFRADGTHWDAQTPLTTSAAFSPDGELLVLGTALGAVELYETRTATRRWQMSPHTQRVTVGFAANNEAIVSMSADGTGRWTPVRDTAQSVRLNGHRADLYALKMATFTNRFATVDAEGVVRVWDNPVDWSAFTPSVRLGRTRTAALAADGRTVITAFEDGSVLAQFPVDEQRAPVWMPRADGDSVPIAVLAIAPDGRRVVALPEDGSTPLLWTVGRNAPTRLTMGTADGSFRTVTFSGDGRTLVLAQMDGRIFRGDALRGAVQEEVITCNDSASLVAVSDDGEAVAAACPARNVVILNGPDGVMEQPTDDMSYVHSLRFSPDGGALLIAGVANHAVLLETRGPYRTTRLTGRQTEVYATAFSADGRMVVTGSSDKTVEVYAVPPFPSDTNVELDDVSAGPPLKGHRFPVLHVAFSVDQQSIVSTSAEGAVRIWKQGPDGYGGTGLAHPQPLPPSPYLEQVASVYLAQPRMVVSVSLSAQDDLERNTSYQVSRYRRWDLDAQSLTQRLRRRTSACVPLDFRRLVVPVERESAEARTNQCLVRNGRLTP